MNCPHCTSLSTKEQRKKLSSGIGYSAARLANTFLMNAPALPSIISNRKCQNSGQGVVTEGMSPHVSHKKATQCSHFPYSLLILAVVSPLCVSFLCRVLSSDTSAWGAPLRAAAAYSPPRSRLITSISGWVSSQASTVSSLRSGRSSIGHLRSRSTNSVP
jgi:hypothetical protein